MKVTLTHVRCNHHNHRHRHRHHCQHQQSSPTLLKKPSYRDAEDASLSARACLMMHKWSTNGQTEIPLPFYGQGRRRRTVIYCTSKRTIWMGIWKEQGHIHNRPSRGGWAGAVMGRAGGSAVHTTASVTCNWAGAVMQQLLAKCQKLQKSKGRTDRLTDQQAD